MTRNSGVGTPQNLGIFGSWQPWSPQGTVTPPCCPPVPHLDEEVAVLVLCHHHGRVVQLLLEVDVALCPLLGVALCPLGGEAHSCPLPLAACR